MVATVQRRSSTVLYSDPECPYCHRIRFILAEKGVEAEIENVDLDDRNHEVYKITPTGMLPTFLDRNLTIYNSIVIAEYLDERFPYPPLLPVYPVARAQSRLLIQHIEEGWCTHADTLLAGKGGRRKLDKARVALSESLAEAAHYFLKTPFFMSEEITLADCFLAPLFWRLPLLNLKMSERSEAAIEQYASRLFQRKAFLESLSEEERAMRP